MLATFQEVLYVVTNTSRQWISLFYICYMYVSCLCKTTAETELQINVLTTSLSLLKLKITGAIIIGILWYNNYIDLHVLQNIIIMHINFIVFNFQIGDLRSLTLKERTLQLRKILHLLRNWYVQAWIY